jgi:hypothetical protein
MIDQNSSFVGGSDTNCQNKHSFSTPLFNDEEKLSAITKAIDDCIEQNVLKDFLQNHKKEVIGMLLRELDLNTTVALAEEMGGKKQLAIKVAKEMKDKGKSIDEIIEITDLTVDDILAL